MQSHAPAPRSSIFRRIGAVVATLALVGFGVLGFAVPANAATTHVVSSALDDNSAGTIREAAGLAVAGDSIRIDVDLAPGSTVTFPQGVTIFGNVPTRAITRGANANYALFTFAAAGNFQEYTVSDLTMTGGTGIGSAIHVGGGITVGKLTLSNVDIEGHSAPTGAGVLIDALSNKLTILDSTISNNHATVGAGGGVWGDLNQGGAEISRTVIEDNTAFTTGGGVYLESNGVQNFLFDDLTVTGNDAGTDAGGGLFIDGAFNLTMSGGTYSDNTAQNAGGAAYIGGAATVTVSGPIEFDGNESTGNSGGALYLTSTTFFVEVDGATFTENHAVGRGGALEVLGAAQHTTVTNSAFDSNVADISGGALYLASAGSTTVDDTTFTSNSAPSGGGVGILSTTGTNRFDRDVFTSNSAASLAAGQGGGAIGVGTLSNTLLVSDSTLASNRADAHESGAFGGAIYLDEVEASGFLDIGGTTFSDNFVDAGLFADGGGASVAVTHMAPDSGMRMSNSTISETLVSAGEAAFWFDTVDATASLRMGLTTVVAPVAIEIHDNSSTDLEVSSTILAADVHDLGDPAVVVLAGSPVGLDYTLTPNAADAAVADNGGNQFSVAAFKLGPLQSNGGITQTMALLPGSPAIDRGEPGGGPTFDQRGAGFPRMLNGRMDAGAFESVALLAATGGTINPWIPIGGGILLLLGVGAIVFTRVKRRAD